MEGEIREIMLVIPNIIDESVPIGRDDSENVEVERFGDPFVPEFEVPYHVDIMEKLDGIDLDSARKPAETVLLSLRRYSSATVLHTFLCERFYD